MPWFSASEIVGHEAVDALDIESLVLSLVEKYSIHLKNDEDVLIHLGDLAEAAIKEIGADELASVVTNIAISCVEMFARQTGRTIVKERYAGSILFDHISL
jgi:hypothetical protein